MLTTGLILIFQQPKGRANTSASLGIGSLAIGLAYFTTAYVPIEQNQFLYASVPVRLVLAAVAVVRAYVLKGPLEENERRNMIGIALLDGVGGVALGWYLGEFGGRISVSY